MRIEREREKKEMERKGDIDRRMIRKRAGIKKRKD